MKISSGGSAAVYMCLSRVSSVIVSGLGRTFLVEDPVRARKLGDGESGASVGDEDLSSSDLPSADSSLMVGSFSAISMSNCLVRMFRVIRDCEKGVVFGRGGARYSSTVARIADVISSRDVYGKQMLRTALPTTD
jgi:hypothetical protein